MGGHALQSHDNFMMLMEDFSSGFTAENSATETLLFRIGTERVDSA